VFFAHVATVVIKHSVPYSTDIIVVSSAHQDCTTLLLCYYDCLIPAGSKISHRASTVKVSIPSRKLRIRCMQSCWCSCIAARRRSENMSPASESVGFRKTLCKFNRTDLRLNKKTTVWLCNLISFVDRNNGRARAFVGKQGRVPSLFLP